MPNERILWSGEVAAQRMVPNVHVHEAPEFSSHGLGRSRRTVHMMYAGVAVKPFLCGIQRFIYMGTSAPKENI